MAYAKYLPLHPCYYLVLILRNKIIKLSNNNINLRTFALKCTFRLLLSGECYFFIFVLYFKLQSFAAAQWAEFHLPFAIGGVVDSWGMVLKKRTLAVGNSVGFLIFNLHPAKIFMGDTGSLFFGALAAGAVFSLSNPLLIIAIGGVYVIEGISVILQVSYYKLSGKRLFKMAPIHHHFERLGLSENTICIIAILLTFILSVPAYIFYLP